MINPTAVALWISVGLITWGWMGLPTAAIVVGILMLVGLLIN